MLSLPSTGARIKNPKSIHRIAFIGLKLLGKYSCFPFNFGFKPTLVDLDLLKSSAHVTKKLTQNYLLELA